jgi:glutathione S-transferase
MADEEGAMMSTLTLVMGNKNYSSWSIRPWLAMKATGIPFDEIVIPLGEPGTEQEIAKRSPSGRLPVLLCGELKIWDSLAICEYLAERFPEKNLWPTDFAARAEARSVSAEMHAGFTALRSHMPCTIRSSHPGKGMAAGVGADIDRIQRLWRACRARHGSGGPFLFGAFSIADAFYAPVVGRFTIYHVHVDDVSREYMTAMWALPAMQQWRKDATNEPWRVEKYERY